MSFLLENIQTPLSEQTAYILGGIVSACSYNEDGLMSRKSTN